ncbi:MAG: PilN domain-containing protein [Planococcus sp. (in: firmicutes)]|uniref:PilN domain-containing protein n=1 Tax=Planococcus halocryophilus TaxID=1215089 RepID=UPI001F0CECDD|nr:PilN domain-containing protein [Planococcus halocryophilus]MCH4825627.1 PilN domain-containing protein [Planococcus halocryophilus]
MLVDINLLPQKEHERPVLLFAILGILLVTILIWATFFLMAQSQKSEKIEADAEYIQVMTESSVIQAELEAAVGLTDEQQLKTTVDWAESYQFDTIPLLSDLSARLPERGFLESFSYTKPNLATITVQFDAARQAAYYLAQLKASDLIQSVQLDSTEFKELEIIGDTGFVEKPETPVEVPRYVATYNIAYVDVRLPAEEELDADGNIIEEVETEEIPNEETVEVDVTVEETEATPSESEGDAQ